jgi:hypothetical protein
MDYMSHMAHFGHDNCNLNVPYGVLRVLKVNVLSLLLNTTGHFLVYCEYRKNCKKYISYIAMGHQMSATENAGLTSGA